MSEPSDNPGNFKTSVHVKGVKPGLVSSASQEPATLEECQRIAERDATTAAYQSSGLFSLTGKGKHAEVSGQCRAEKAGSADDVENYILSETKCVIDMTDRKNPPSIKCETDKTPRPAKLTPPT